VPSSPSEDGDLDFEVEQEVGQGREAGHKGGGDADQQEHSLWIGERKERRNLTLRETFSLRE